jgi:hypothetical protein
MACLTKVQVNSNFSGIVKFPYIFLETRVSHTECPEELKQHHNDNNGSAGIVSATYFELVHNAVPRNIAEYLKRAKDAINKDNITNPMLASS